MTAENVKTLKRTLLCMLNTAELALIKDRLCTEAPVPAYVAVRDVRAMLGVWNGALPSSIALRRRAHLLEEVVVQTRDPREWVLLYALRDACATIAVTPSALWARDDLAKMHEKMILEFEGYRQRAGSWERFWDKRRSKFQGLAEQIIRGAYEPVRPRQSPTVHRGDRKAVALRDDRAQATEAAS